MTDADVLRGAFASIEVNEEFSEAVLVLRDGSRLAFRHRVGERRVEAGGSAADPTIAGGVLAKIVRFRLNRRHLDVEFQDGSRWEILFGDPGGRR